MSKSLSVILVLGITLLAPACSASLDDAEATDETGAADELPGACIDTPFTSKFTANRPVSSSCPAGYAVNGVNFTHRAGQNLTYQESFSVRCCPAVMPVAGSTMGALVQKWPLVVAQSAAADAVVTGIAFEHKAGQNQTHEEKFAVMSSNPVPLLSAASTCYVTPWQSKSPLTIKPRCSTATDYVQRVDLSHPFGQNLVHQESVRLQCCSVGLVPIGGGDPGDPPVITPL